MSTIIKKLRIYFSCSAAVGFLLLSSLGHSNLLALEKTHDQLFDHFFPASPLLSPDQESLRISHRQRTWEDIKTSPDFQNLLSLFPENTSPIKHLEILIKSKNPDKIKKAFIIRKLYLNLCYSDPIANKIGDITPEVMATQPSNLIIPKSHLQVKEDTITHRLGDIDILIIGSGPAGSLIASELRKKHPNNHILMVEAGSFVDPETHVTALDSDLIESNNLRTTTSGGIILRNGRAVGGGTTVNIDLAFSPLLPLVKEKLSSWITREQAPKHFFHYKSKDWNALKSTYEWVVQTVGTRSVAPEEINTNNQLLMDAVSTAKTYDLNQKPYRSGPPQILKNGGIEKFIMPTLKSTIGTGSFSLLNDTKTLTLTFDTGPLGRKATGVVVEIQSPLNRPYTLKNINGLKLSPGKTYSIKAKNIIVSAGTLGSAELLLRSKINNSNIGKGIVIHPSMGIVGQFDREINAHKGLSASVYAPSPIPKDGYYFEAMGDIPSFIALIHPGSGSQVLESVVNFKKLGGYGVMLVDTPHPKNRVFIDPLTDKVEVDYTLDKQDLHRFRKALIHGVTALFKVGAKSVFIPSQEIAANGQNPVFTTPNEAIAAINNLTFVSNLNFITSAHMQGSNKIGSNPKTSVVSQKFKIWDGTRPREIQNLYLVDSSIFPTSVGANPMQTIYTFAKFFSDSYE